MGSAGARAGPRALACISNAWLEVFHVWPAAHDYAAFALAYDRVTDGHAAVHAVEWVATCARTAAAPPERPDAVSAQRPPDSQQHPAVSPLGRRRSRTGRSAAAAARTGGDPRALLQSRGFSV